MDFPRGFTPARGSNEALRRPRGRSVMEPRWGSVRVPASAGRDRGRHEKRPETDGEDSSKKAWPPDLFAFLDGRAAGFTTSSRHRLQDAEVVLRMNLQKWSIHVDDDRAAEREERPFEDRRLRADRVRLRVRLDLDADAIGARGILRRRSDRERVEPDVDRPEAVGRMLSVADRPPGRVGVAARLLPPGDPEPLERRRQERDRK